MPNDRGLSGSLTLIDTASLFLAGEALGEQSPAQRRISPDYGRLNATLARIRVDAGWSPAKLTVGLAAVDPMNEAQRRFVDALRHAGLEVDAVDYRSTFPSQPPGLARKEGDRQAPSFAPRIAYIIGLTTRHPQVALLIVSHAFELYAPLLDLAHRVPNARVGVAYFASLLDYRWHRAEKRDKSSGTPGVEVFDLDSNAPDIFGIQVGSKSSVVAEVRGGLNRLYRDFSPAFGH